MCFRTENPERDFDRWDAEQAIQLEMLPECCCCNEPIQQEDAVCINDEWFCDSCLADYFRKPVEDYAY